MSDERGIPDGERMVCLDGTIQPVKGNSVMENEKLRTCPFCGSTASWLDDRECNPFNEVSCNNNIQACVMPNFPMSATAWNTRATQPTTDLSAERKAALEWWNEKYPPAANGNPYYHGEIIETIRKLLKGE